MDQKQSPGFFQILKKDKQSHARRSMFYTRQGPLQMPLFCPVATKASVKSLDSKDLEDLNPQMLLANAYHLHLRPGEKLIQKQGGIHRFMDWSGSVLTDSGGYQIFSLSSLRKITDEGVLFQNHLDGGALQITPQTSINIQWDLGADILMAFDHCPQGGADKKSISSAVERTFKWLKRSKKSFLELKEKTNTEPGRAPLLFGIVQGSVYEDLRQMSLDQVESMNLPGIAVGGMSVGEPKEKMQEALRFLSSKLPENKPRYLMGIGLPEDLIFAIDCGFDLFDCVLPTRMGRTGRLWTKHGALHIQNEKYKEDSQPVEPACRCLACRKYTRSYLRHLFMSRELLAYRLAALHNLRFYMDLMENARSAISQGVWAEFRDQSLAQLQSCKK